MFTVSNAICWQMYRICVLYCWQYRLLFYISRVTAVTQHEITTIYGVQSYLHTRPYVPHFSVATCIICELMDIAVCFTHHLPHIHIGMASFHRQKFYLYCCHGHSCSSRLFWRPRLNTPCWGATGGYSVIASSVISISPSGTVFCSISRLCSLSFCTTWWPMLSNTKSEFRQKVRELYLANCSWSGTGTPNVAYSKKSDKITHSITVCAVNSSCVEAQICHM